MKKKYVAPKVSCISLRTASLIAGSKQQVIPGETGKDPTAVLAVLDCQLAFGYSMTDNLGPAEIESELASKLGTCMQVWWAPSINYADECPEGKPVFSSGTRFVKITRDADGYYFIEENPSDCGGGSTGGGGWWPSWPW